MGIKYKVNEDFFKKWTRENSYILGFILADGSLENASYIRGRYIRLANTDYSLINKIKIALESAHKIVVIPHVPNEYLPDFIRGYFDGDGTLAIEETKDKPHNRLKTIFTSGSRLFLVSLKATLQKQCKISIGTVYDSHRSYQLIYRSRHALDVLKFIYSGLHQYGSIYLGRKYLKYKKLMLAPNLFGCGNLFDRNSRIWKYSF